MSEFNIRRRETVLEAVKELKVDVAEKTYVKVNGAKPAQHYRVGQKMLREAVRRMESEGYRVYVVEQSNAHDVRILTSSDVTEEDIKRDASIITKL
jgi:7-keto-8-aminopelargonate synthetase-like enzyme